LNTGNPSHQQLINYFEGYFPFNTSEHTELFSRFTERSVKRRHFVFLQQGDVCRHFSFVISGCFKMYAADKNGNKHNIQFAAENDRPATSAPQPKKDTFHS
jgi:CRP-like cAMP-binding protein